MKRILLVALCLMACIMSKSQTFYICSEGNTETTTELNFSDGGSTLNDEFNTAYIDSITPHVPALQFVGGDLSLLSKYESQGAKYKGQNGQAVGDVLDFLKEQGWNTIRVRLMVDPTNTDDPKSVVQDLDYVIDLGRRVKEAGMLLMLDFHYSDTWADPGSQWTPAAWASLSDAQLYEKIYDYTRDCLEQMNAAGASPDFIQTGNEISYGMLWGTKAAVGNNQTNRCFTNSSAANWNRFTTLLKQAGKACREVCPRAQIIIHSERTPKPGVLTDFFDRMKSAGVDYDIIGLSYYPYFHGALSVLNTALTTQENKHYGKRIQVVETGYPSQWAVPGTEYDYSATYPYSTAGQQQFTADLIALLKEHPLVNGLSWWYAEANAFGCSGDLKNGWYNAGLFDNSTGQALPALYEMENFK